MGLQSLDQLPVLDDPGAHTNVLQTMAVAAQGQTGAEPSWLTAQLQPGLEQPQDPVITGVERVPAGVFFQKAETDLRGEDTDTRAVSREIFDERFDPRNSG